MDRREALNRVAWLMGGTIIGGQLFIEACTRPATENVEGLFTDQRIQFLGDIADTILPETKTPGAKEAGVGSFIPVMVRDCYTPQDQKVFLEGLDKLEESAKKEFGKTFQKLPLEQRTEFLKGLDQEQ